ncbi:hypothetical protein LTR86_008445 [Recurvomyces mirabilis]|nr:hypothetical protein LTR86_008445 [Recurvomyces mirabilis]
MSNATSNTTNVPPSDVAVKVSAIDTTLTLHGMKCSHLWQPAIKGFDYFSAGTWSLLIEHPSGRKLLYDLGCRKDWENLPPTLNLKHYLDNGILKQLKIEKNVSDILVDGGVSLDEIEGVIWSHWHFDHTGDVSTFPSTTKLIVGARTKANFTPGYPTDPNAQTLDTDFADREVLEMDVESTTLQIGGLKAFDYFGDGSFYILDSPGHAVGHLSALARTNASPKSDFVHMCGDAAHHGGEIRPSKGVQLPDSISPSPVPDIYASTCPGHFFEPVLRNGSREKHILEWQDFTAGMGVERRYAGTYDEPVLRETVSKTEDLDADENVLTVMAHDWTLKGVMEVLG